MSEEVKDHRSQFEIDMFNLVEEEMKKRAQREILKISRELRARLFNPHELLETSEMMEVLDRQIGDPYVVTEMIVRLFANLVNQGRVRVEDVRKDARQSEGDLSGAWNMWEPGSSYSNEGELNVAFLPKSLKDDSEFVHQLWIRARKK